MNNPQITKRLEMLEGIDLPSDRLTEVEELWRSERPDVGSLANSLRLDHCRNRSLLGAFEGLTPEMMLALLQAWRAILSLKHKQVPRTRICLTGINPEGFKHPMVDTTQAFLEIVSQAKKKVVILGYRITDGDSGFIDAIERAMRERGVELSVVTDHLLQRMRDERQPFVRWFKDGDLRFRLWSYEPPDPIDIMHIKCIISDDSKAYVGSANFSYGGSRRNVEVGLLVQDREVIMALSDVFRTITSGGLENLTEIKYSDFFRMGLI